MMENRRLKTIKTGQHPHLVGQGLVADGGDSMLLQVVESGGSHGEDGELLEVEVGDCVPLHAEVEGLGEVGDCFWKSKLKSCSRKVRLQWRSS